MFRPSVCRFKNLLSSLVCITKTGRQTNFASAGQGTFTRPSRAVHPGYDRLTRGLLCSWSMSGAGKRDTPASPLQPENDNGKRMRAGSGGAGAVPLSSGKGEKRATRASTGAPIALTAKGSLYRAHKDTGERRSTSSSGGVNSQSVRGFVARFEIRLMWPCVLSSLVSQVMLNEPRLF